MVDMTKSKESGEKDLYGVAQNEHLIKNKKPSPKKLRLFLSKIVGGLVLVWAVFSGTIYLTPRIYPSLSVSSSSYNSLKTTIQDRVDSYLNKPLRELRSLALQLSMWVTLPEAALKRSLRLASFRNPELTEILVADSEGQVIASFDPALPLSQESTPVGSPDPHDSRRKLMEEKKRSVFLFRKNGDEITGILIGVPLFSNETSRGELTELGGVITDEPTKNNAISDHVSHDAGSNHTEMRGYLGATLPLNPLFSWLKKLKKKHSSLKIGLSTPSQSILPVSGISTQSPSYKKKGKNIGTSKNGTRPRLLVTIKPPGTLQVLAFVALSGFLASLSGFLFFFALFGMEIRKQIR